MSEKRDLICGFTMECGFTLKRLRDMIITYSQCTVQLSTHNTAQSFGQFG